MSDDYEVRWPIGSTVTFTMHTIGAPQDVTGEVVSYEHTRRTGRRFALRVRTPYHGTNIVEPNNPHHNVRNGETNE